MFLVIIFICSSSHSIQKIIGFEINNKQKPPIPPSINTINLTKEPRVDDLQTT